MQRPKPTLHFPSWDRAKVDLLSQWNFYPGLNEAVSNVNGLDLGGWLDAAEQTIPLFGMVSLPASALGGDSHLADLPSYLLCRTSANFRDSITGNILTNGQKWLGINCRRRVFFAASQSGVKGEREREKGGHLSDYCIAARHAISLSLPYPLLF